MLQLYVMFLALLALAYVCKVKIEGNILLTCE